MGDEPSDADADRTTADWSFVAVEPVHSPARNRRPERPLRGVQRSVWFPIIIGVAGWQWTGLIFGPFRAAESRDWTWILTFYMTVYSVLPAQICLLNLGLLFGPGPIRRRGLVYWLASIALLAS